MCTVTFIPTPGGICLTSNRDESSRRSRALLPAVHPSDGSRLLYPKDPDAGGSWITLREDGGAAVLLNGAFTKHRSTPPYRQSRGLVLLAIVQAPEPFVHFQRIDLTDTEPFTLVLVENHRLQECRWDGCRKHIRELDSTKPHIWSSATLYTDEIAATRRQSLDAWLRQQNPIVWQDVLDFHRRSLTTNTERKISTVSITSILLANPHAKMLHYDLHTGTLSVTGFAPRKTALKKSRFRDNLSWRLKAFWTKWTHWEYWPAHLVYGPLYPYWLWLSLKARSFFFFSAANPGIEYAGFTQERKSEIYKLIPKQYYPKTILCKAGVTGAELQRVLADQNQNDAFPLIAKPDIGERGTGVSLLNSLQQLEQYCRKTKVDFLIQEYISFEKEVGIFYSRIPGEPRGRITGIVAKEFLAVTGDGHSSIKTLLGKTPRFLLQLPALRERYGDFLLTILPLGERCTLVPYGNHCRGARFDDRSDKITPQLATVIDDLCKQIPGFYFGRLDIKFNDWAELSRGINFSVIEVNGAGSEPTHIYDPAHSLFFAWKEIIRHWRLLYRTSALNVQREKIPLMDTAEGLKMLRDRARHQRLIKRV